MEIKSSGYVETIIKGSGSGTALPGSTTLRVIGMQPACKCTSMTNPLDLAAHSYFHFNFYCSAVAAFCSSGIRKTGATSEARREKRGDSHWSPRAVTRRACVSLCSCVSSLLPNLTFVPSQQITHEWLPAMSCTPAPSSSPG